MIYSLNKLSRTYYFSWRRYYAVGEYYIVARESMAGQTGLPGKVCDGTRPDTYELYQHWGGCKPDEYVMAFNGGFSGHELAVKELTRLTKAREQVHGFMFEDSSNESGRVAFVLGELWACGRTMHELIMDEKISL